MSAGHISIITVTKNSTETVLNCVSAVKDQSTTSEHIIIDGGSTDGTLDILKQHSSDTLTYISEPDQGPYDAMNKGINMATGDIIGILNSDDIYADSCILESVAEAFEDPSIDSCYGAFIMPRT